MTDLLPYPPELRATGTADAPFRPTLPATDLPPGAMRRVTFGDLDLLLANTPLGIVAVDDRCPHMAAPLSIGGLEGCVVACPLHSGRFDLASGDPVQMPTTGGLSRSTYSAKASRLLKVMSKTLVSKPRALRWAEM